MKKQFIKFITVGLLSTAISYAIFLIALHAFSVNYLFSSAIGFLAGVVVGFFFNKNWTFQSGDQSKKIVIAYFLVYLISLGISLVFLKIAVELIGASPEVANFLAIGITTCTNFIGTKFFVFKK